ncbi:hypothetical protein [Pseudonocardia alaniniphila]|uniref:Protein phosphatase 2C-like protein n=1 Tax=Pseudonocardia alaniniphila TaxID=75291 RepID=A0ABS9TET2_9PSEU|nr:hypothetical protein [Pseudonocardia alaniniphila]MCH6167045.1 hypothetical protein [Pseudonocardia alaniniphila]
MKVHTAQLAGDGRNADRVFLTDNAVIVLDGASAFEPVDIEPSTYAESLGRTIADELTMVPEAPIADAVAKAIRRTTAKLDLRPGASPSSTVAILRTRFGAADLYVLGDSPIHYGTDHLAQRLVDDRLSLVATPEHERYLAQLRAGHGYDDAHRATLAWLQRAQRQARNVEGGYWIAETDPAAASHAFAKTVHRDAIEWAVIATDGAADFIDYCCCGWRDIAQFDKTQLVALLKRIHDWEDQSDPDGRHLPRAKRHDDKTIGVVSSLWA